MSSIILWRVFAALTILGSNKAPAQSLPRTALDKALRVNILSAPSTKGILSFTVQNTSLQPILCYALAISYTYSDGATSTMPFPMDFTTTLPLVGRVVAAPAQDQIGPIPPQKSVPYKIHIGHRTDHGPVVRTAIVPMVVIFENNTVIGDGARASSDFFSPHVALAKEYGEYLRSLDQARKSADVLARLAQLQGKYTQAGNQPDAAGIAIALRSESLQNGYKRIGWELQSLIRQLERNPESSAAILSSHVSLMQAHRSAYLAHSAPAVAEGQR